MSLGKRFAIWLVSWAFRLQMPEKDIRHAMARSWKHRDQAWRDEVYEAGRKRNRDRLMRVNA